MFAISYETMMDGRIFKICSTQEETEKRARRLCAQGYEVTVYRYDEDTKTYCESYTL